MIQKSVLQSVINKYHLKGQIETVKFSVSNNILAINFQVPTGEMIGSLTYSQFPLEDSQFVIYNTEQLLKLINITSTELKVNLVKNHQLPVRLNIEDDKFKLSYFLSDLMLAPKIGKVKEIEFDTEICLKDHLDSLIKAKEALPNIDALNIVGENKNISFIFGEDNNFSNKVVYDIPSDNLKVKFKLPFSSDLVKEILTSNKDINGDGSLLKINTKGLVNFSFKNENIQTSYYLTRKI
jgi:hypothetical protein